MTEKFKNQQPLQADFSEIIKKAYEKGENDKTITIEELLEDIKVDLKKITIHS